VRPAENPGALILVNDAPPARPQSPTQDRRENSAMARATPLGYSTTQIVLHWVIAALVLFQLLFNQGMQDAWDAIEKGAPAGGFNIHAAVGLLTFALVLWRIGLRLTRGAPPAPAEEHPALKLLAKAVHVLLYALILLLPLGGAMAWILGVQQAAQVHATVQILLWPLIGLHILGALAHTFVFRTGVMRRMLVPEKR